MKPNDTSGASQHTTQPQSAELSNTPAQSENSEQQLNDTGQQMSSFDRSTLRWTRFAGTVATLAAAFVCLQWCVMRGQLNEMKSGSADTRTLAKAAIEQADTNKMLLKGQFAAFIRAEMGGILRGQTLTINIGFDNQGKIKTKSVAKYKITLVSLPNESIVRNIGSYTAEDLVPSQGERPMPNHYYTIRHLTEKELSLYRNFSEGFRAEGYFRYDDGFGETVESHFCLVNSGFTNYTCQNVPLLLPSQNATKH